MTRSPVIGQAIERALNRRLTGSPDAIAAIALALAVHGHPRAVALAACVIDGTASAGARNEAVIALGLLEITESTVVLLRALDRVRRPETIVIILEHLRQRRAPGGDQRLRRLVASRDPRVRWAALALVARRRTTTDIALLRRLLQRAVTPDEAGPVIEIIRRERVRACDDLLRRMAEEGDRHPRVRQALRFAVAWRGLEVDASGGQRARALADLASVWPALDEDLQGQALGELGAFPPEVRREVLGALRPHHVERSEAPISAALARLIATAGSSADRRSLLARMEHTDMRGRALAAVALAGIAPECLFDRQEPAVRTRLIVRAAEEGILFYQHFMRDRHGASIPYAAAAGT
jgi:hypothetical protein